MSKGKDRDALGAAAENWVEGRLTRAGATCIRPSLDRAGYDLTCYFSGASGPDASGAWPASQAFRAALPTEPSFTVLLQVKASEELARNPPRVKLDNLQRFIDWPNPAFFLVLEYAKKAEEPRTGYLLHFDQQRLARALERLWKLSEKDAQSIHKIKERLL